MSCTGCANLLVQVILKLSERLSLTRGQMAIAAELVAREVLGGRKTDSIPNAISLALDSVGLVGRVEEESGIHRIEVPSTCPLRDICPLPFFVTAAVREMTGKKVYLLVEEGKAVYEKEGRCVFSLKAQ